MFFSTNAMALEALSPVILALMRLGSQLLSQWWKSQAERSDSIIGLENDSQRSPATTVFLTHTPTVLPPTSQPVLIVSHPSSSTIQLLEYSQQVTPEFILYLCSFGILCFIFLASFALYKTCVRFLYLFIRIVWNPNPPTPTQRTTRDYAPTHQQLSDAARHLFHFVRAQNPELTGEHREPQDESFVLMRRRS